MASYDYWTDGIANWDSPSDWSVGLPTASSDVLIRNGNPEVTASFGTVASIKINQTYSAALSFIDAGASAVAGDVTVKSGGLTLDAASGDGGSSLTIGRRRRLTNDGTIQIGPSDGTLSADSMIQAAHLLNTGTIDLYGSSTAQATLDVTSGASFGTKGTLTGNVNLSGDTLVEFKGGQITTIAGALSLIGSRAFVADGSNTGLNSALKGLNTLAGALDLANGAAVKTSGDLGNSGTIALDQASGEGGSWLNVHGTLTNDGTIDIGNGSLSARSAVWAESVVNTGTINVHGVGDGDETNIHATLKSTGAFTNDGSVNFTDDYDKLAGAVSGTGNFSLADDATLEFGNGVSSGQVITFGGGDNNRLILDQASSFDGTIDDFFAKGDAVRAKTFAEAQTLLKYTQTGADSCSWTLTDGSNTAVLNFAGAPYAQSDFSIVSANGGAGLAIVRKTSIGLDYWEDGAANWNTPSDWSAGLPDRTSNVVIGTGNPEVTAKFGSVGSITISTRAALTFVGAGANSVVGGVTNSGTLELDSFNEGGGSSLTIGGTLTNDRTIKIGPAYGVRSAVKAESVVNNGTIELIGDQLHSTGAFTNDGSVNFYYRDVDKIAGAVSGTGVFALHQGSTLEFGAGVSSGETVTFATGSTS
jgi:cytoskeletal protein CcmA (bactofilin family)